MSKTLEMQVNHTIMQVHTLIPENFLPSSNSYGKRSLLPFIGQFSGTSVETLNLPPVHQASTQHGE
ncbi:hypothetical protein KUTeg_014635 [Tegillarca granosa]|uniref:Uncharacterized protein n=1 Tax=Tegillarca granosa TaxID=220873 RepID=A0ABQ9ERK5_TEGGR|nr:hypothetical protein KUTeg_014635 [Tegillarca granosa]